MSAASPAFIEALQDAGAYASVADWLAGLLAAPLSAEALTHYRSAEGGALLDAIAEEFGGASGIARMRAMLNADAEPGVIARRLSVAYTMLFEGVAGPATVPLCESAYRGEGARLFGQPVDDMAELLWRGGRSVSQACCEPPDHVSIEFALLAALLRDGDEEGARVLHARLCAWVPSFIARCQAQDPHGFYGAVVTVIEALLEAPVGRHG